MKTEIQQFAVALATWPPGTDGWLHEITPEERAFQQKYGIARLIVVLKPESTRLHPIIRLTQARYPDLTDSAIEAAKQDVVRYIQTCLGDESYTAKDLAASMLTAPRELAIWMIRSLKEAENRLQEAEKVPEKAEIEPEITPKTTKMTTKERETRKPGSMPPLPDDIRVVGPDSPNMGYLQLIRAGSEKTLCLLPVQPYWLERLPEEFSRYTPCRGCLAALERDNA